MKFRTPILSFLLIASFAVPAIAQDETKCQEIENKKAKKLYEQGIDKKYKKEERLAFLTQAMDLEPDNAEHANEYAYALASCPDPSHRDAKLALELSDKALTLAKDPQSQEAWWHRDTQAGH